LEITDKESDDNFGDDDGNDDGDDDIIGGKNDGN
jgi:hypothetical protein